jgi:protein O-GlcNAc transferase
LGFGSLSRSADPERRLRVGYVSADFNWHPVALFLLPAVERHDLDNFEVFCYYTADKIDDVTRSFMSLPVTWIDASKLSDKELATRVHEDHIDILVDLAGHTATSRLPVFAQQPSPVQVSWMGYLNTTGLTRMHYRLCDKRTDPVGIADALHTEKLVRLPHSQWCYRPFIIVETTEQAPWEKNGFITFDSYNHALKISPAVCALWADILHQVPGSQLLCVGLNSTRKMAELLSELTLTGVDSERIRFVARTSLDQYFGWFSEADIALDTFPYGGGTTTFDALWMGVPVVAAKGNTPTSRSAASILEALELDDWVAPSIDDYVRVAVERANDRERIAELRRSLRPRLQSSPLMDEPRFVRDIEAAYRTRWQEWCAKGERQS